MAGIAVLKFQGNRVFELIVIPAGNGEQVGSRHVHDRKFSISESESIGSRIEGCSLKAEFGLSNKEALIFFGDRCRVSRGVHHSRQHKLAAGVLHARRIARLYGRDLARKEERVRDRLLELVAGENLRWRK